MVRKLFLLTVAFVAASTLSCGSTESNADEQAKVPVNVANASNARETVPPDNRGIPVNPQVSNADINAEPAGNVDVARSRKLGEGPAQPTMTKPAPENSTLGTEMGPGGSFIESRVFNRDGYLAKVQKIYNGPEKGVKIFLRNGKVVKVAFEKVPQLNIISAAELRELAGIKLPPAPSGINTDQKKKQ